MNAAGDAVRGLLRRSTPPLVAAVVIVTAWQLFVSLADVKSFILPAPSAILTALRDDWSIIRAASVRTIQEVLLGLALGTIWGTAVAVVLSRIKRLSAPVLAFAAAVNCAPIVALAPIANNWLGISSLISKAAVAGVMVFFPVLMGVTRGLSAVPQTNVELMYSYAAGPLQTVRYVNMPNALQYLFSALRLGSTLAVIGAIVTEYFGGPTSALGVYIANKAALPRFPAAWAGVVVASTIGLVLFGLVVLLERLVMPWHASVSGGNR